jgi:UDP-N-acetylglucosamine diphosphorylase / glucose-1-phosphate thymidylyltransferase / UDP-N-acetylgalactosamine diphosphorylase / glucosamine-1-phosphate N-acetyltransferase / galactosamine-1-phosphate N-acetyltransferase
MIRIADFIEDFDAIFPTLTNLLPWQITNAATASITNVIAMLDNNFVITNGIAIHKTTVVENGAVIKAPAVIGANSFIAAHAYLRGGVFVGTNVTIGPGCEIKSSFICNNTSIAHFNFIGDSIVGNNVNIEAGAIAANHYNERDNKTIFVKIANQLISTDCAKFGSLIADGVTIGANAVLSPGTILLKGINIERLQLVNQQA